MMGKCPIVDGLRYEGGPLMDAAANEIERLRKDAARYTFCLNHPALAAKFFIQWKTTHRHYNHTTPGVHPSDAIDAKLGK